MAEFIPVDALTYLRGRDMASQTQYRNSLTGQQNIANMLALEKAQAMRQFGKEATGPVEGAVPGQDFPNAGAELGGQPSAAEVPMWQQQLDLAAKERRNSNIAMKLGLVAEADKFSDNARQYMSDARTAKADADKLQVEGLDRAIQWATAAKNPLMYEVIRDMAEKEAARTGTPDLWGQLQLPRNWEPGVDKKLDAIANASIAAKDRIKIEQDAATLVETKRIHDADIAHKQKTAAQADQRIELDRAGLSLRETELRESREERAERTTARKVEQDDRHTESIVKDVNAGLQKNTVIKNFDKYEQGRQLAQNMKAELAKPGNPYGTTLTPPMTTSLRDAFIAMSGDYRSRAGTNMSEKNIASFNGALQKAEKWIGTLGGGTPILSRKGAEEVIAAMEQMSNIATAQAFKDEALAVEAASRRDRTGRAASKLTLRAFGMENLIALRDAKLLEVKETKTIDGVTWPTKVVVDGKTINIQAPKE